MESTEQKEIAQKIRELGLSSKEFGNTLSSAAGAVKRLKNLIGEPGPESNKSSSRLIAAGIALIALPDPTITDAVGTAMVVAGLAKGRMRPTTLSDADRSFREVINKLKNLTRDMTLL